jgi:Holliday junction DNA helicase RuvA
VFDYLRGRLVACAPTRAVIDVGGIGYSVAIPVSTYERLRPGLRADEPVVVLTRLQLLAQQDDIRLYGFATDAERRLFDALLRVQGIGPASALALLSGSSPTDLVRAIGQGDARLLTRAKGIGKKIAERVIVELRDKIHLLIGPEAEEPGRPTAAAADDAARALCSLGYTPQVARKAVEAALADEGAEAAVEALVKAALRHV